MIPDLQVGPVYARPLGSEPPARLTGARRMDSGDGGEPATEPDALSSCLSLFTRSLTHHDDHVFDSTLLVTP